jgi:ABC-type branched-subunit amino acid transport system substrate-binding protein
MHSTRARGLAGLAVVAMVGLVAGCGSSSRSISSNTPVPGDTIGVTPTTITIGQISTITGPIPGGGQGAFDALEAYVDYVNSTGGVNGRQLKLVQKDDALSCTNDSNEVKTLASSTFASVGTFAVLDVCEETPLKAEPTFPVIQGAVLSSALLYGSKASSPRRSPTRPRCM